MNEKPRLWTTTELAEATGMTQGRIRQILRAGDIEGFKVGRDWAIPDAEARRWLEERGIRVSNDDRS
jgi:excisionase family DNA binding protein